MNVSPDLIEATEWLKGIASNNPYAEVGIRIVIHAGHLQRIEKTETIKIRATPSGGGQ